MRKRLSFVCSLLLGTIVTTTLAGCGTTAPEVQKSFFVALEYDEVQGKVSVDKKEGVLESNTEVTLNVTSNAGFEISVIKINNMDVVPKNKITFRPKEGSNSVIVFFKPNDSKPVVDKFNIKLVYDNTKGEALSDVLEGEIGKVDKVNVVVRPNEGFEIEQVTLNNQVLSVSDNKVSFTPLKGENLIKIAFRELPNETQFNVVTDFDSSQGNVSVDVVNGTLESVDKVNVTVTANEGYEISSILVNGKSSEILDTFSFKPIEGENVIKVTFNALPVETSFTVETDFDSTKGDVSVDIIEGIVENVEKVTVSITPKEGFVINNISINRQALEVINETLTFKPVGGVNTVKVLFAPKEATNDFNVVIESYNEAQGMVTADIKEGIVENTDFVTITATPNNGFLVDKIIANGTNLEVVDNKATFKPIKGENIVSVTFIETPIESFTVETTFDSLKGEVTTSVTEGILEEIKEVEVVVTPKEGYLIDTITANGVQLSHTNGKAKFIPLIGVNKVVVIFKEKVVEEKYTVKVKKTAGFENLLTVNLSSNEGIVGENVTFELSYSVERFEVEDILLNGVSIGQNARSFTPIKGENILEIKMKAKTIVPTIDKGKDFTPITRTNETDLSSSKEAIDLVMDKIEEELINKGATEHARKIIDAYAKQFDLYDQVFKKYGITKADINVFYGIVATPSFINILNSDLKEQALIDALTKEIYRIIADIFKGDYSIDKFVGFISTTIFIAVAMTYGQDYGYRLTHYYDYISEQSEVGDFARTVINSSKPSKEKLDKLFGLYETLGQFLYLTIKNCVKAQNATELERLYNLFKKLGLGILGTNNSVDEPISEEELFETITLLNDLLNNNFLSKDGFMNFIDKLYAFGDIAHLHLELFAYTNIVENLYATNLYKETIDEINANKEQVYYLLKFIGLYAKHLEKTDVSDIMYIFSKTSTLGSKELAQLFIIASRYINKVKIAYSQSANAVEAINNIGPLLTKMISAIKYGTVPKTLTNYINSEAIINKLIEIKNNDYTLNNGVEQVVPFAQEVIDSVNNNEALDNIFDHKIALSVQKTNYKLGETNFVVSASYDDVDITNELHVEAFSTNEEGYFVAKITYKQYTFFKTYSVTKNGISFAYDSYIIPVLKLDSDPNLFDKTFVFSDGNKNYKDFEVENRSVIDTSTKGLKTGWVKHLGNYYFFAYEVR